MLENNVGNSILAPCSSGKFAIYYHCISKI